MLANASSLSRVMALTLVVLVLSACGGRASTEPAVTGRPSLSSVLLPWAAFPVQASPRPIVMVEPPVGMERVDGKSPAFPDGPSKEAFLTGAIDPPAMFPGGPAMAAGYPIISAARAFTFLRPASGSKATPSSTSRLAVTAVRLGQATFLTDRGPASLPAWLFSVSPANFLTSVLAIAPEGQWRPAGLRPDAGLGQATGASLGADDRTLTIGLVGGAAGTGPCTSDYALAVTESATAVAVRIIEHPHGSGTEICTLVGYQRTASTILRDRLGNRVVVDAPSGGPIAVTGTR